MSRATLVFTRAARTDLAVIAHHVREYSGSIKSAMRAISAIRSAAESLRDFPMQGKDRSDLVPGLRSWPAGKAIIFYSVDSGGGRVVIRAVFYGGQNFESALPERSRPDTE